MLTYPYIRVVSANQPPLRFLFFTSLRAKCPKIMANRSNEIVANKTKPELVFQKTFDPT